MPTSAIPSDSLRRIAWWFVLLVSPVFSRGASPDSTRHLFDFSSDRSVIVVDPLFDLAWGPVRPAPAFAWVNVRGASFAAGWDEQWSAWGSLEEHQSIRTGAEAWWTALNGSLPGWGRAKLGRDGGQWRTADSLYVDVARAEGGVQWRAPANAACGGLSVKASIDRWNWGLQQTTLGTISKSANTAPAPRVQVLWASNENSTWLQMSKWVLDERGPLGATSESLFEWTQSYSIGHERPLGKSGWAGAVLGHTRLAQKDRLVTSGWTNPASAWWFGVHAKWQQKSWWLGAETATEWTQAVEAQAAANDGMRWLVACGKVWSSGQITLEHLQRPGSPEARALAPAERTLLTHAGLPMGTVWSQATTFRWTNEWSRVGGLSTTFAGSMTNFGDNLSVDVKRTIAENWPIAVNINFTHWLTESLSIFQMRLIWAAGQELY